MGIVLAIIGFALAALLSPLIYAALTDYWRYRDVENFEAALGAMVVAAYCAVSAWMVI